MKHKFICIFLLISIFSSFSSNLYAADSTTPEPYKDDEFPQALKDLRRLEIITLGSMPFVMLDSTLVYSGYKSITGESEGFNLLGSNTFTYEESKKLILTSLGISFSIGLTDFVVRLIKRSSTAKKARIKNNSEAINIYTTEKQTYEDFDNLPENETSSNKQTVEEYESQIKEIEEITEESEVEETE